MKNETKKVLQEDASVLGKLGSEQGYISLTKEQIIKIHDECIKRFGGITGIRDEGLLSSISLSPLQEIFGTELYPSIFEKAAKWLFDFAHYQVFFDGNKRTGWAVCRVFLRVNGYTIDLSDYDKYNFVMRIANNEITEISDIAKILEENSKINLGKTILEVKKNESFER